MTNCNLFQISDPDTDQSAPPIQLNRLRAGEDNLSKRFFGSRVIKHRIDPGDCTEIIKTNEGNWSFITIMSITLTFELSFIPGYISVNPDFQEKDARFANGLISNMLLYMDIYPAWGWAGL